MKRCSTVVVSVARTRSARAEQKLPGMAVSAACIVARNKTMLYYYVGKKCMHRFLLARCAAGITNPDASRGYGVL